MSDMLPVTLIRLSTMGCEDGIVLFLGGHRHGVLALHLKILVQLIAV